MGQRLQLEWQETAPQLKLLYRLERNVHRRIRFLSLWHLRSGKRIQDVVEMIGVCYRTIQYWVAWYREVVRRSLKAQSGITRLHFTQYLLSEVRERTSYPDFPAETRSTNL